MGKIILNGTGYGGSGGSGGVIYLPTIYSDEERQIGVWRDNKPLYARTFDIGSTTVSYNSWTVSSIPKGDMETITHASAVNQNGKAFWGDVMTSLEVDNTYVALQCGRNSANEIMRYVTLYYTKTTDVAGSGNWNTDGVPTHHYSTNEQVVGTWIDGKPLYERTKAVPFANFTHNNDTYFTPIASDNTETLRNVEAIAYSTGYGVCTLGSRAYSRDNTLSYYWELVEYYSNVALHFVGESATDVGVTEVVITYQYTKTTDV